MGKITYKTERQISEYNLLVQKKDKLLNWFIKKAYKLKIANKNYYIGDVTNIDTRLLQLTRHYNTRLNKILKLMKHA
tara:strand:- start:892 stop:1122 length:231 start_codon:yes stop_codon:yes gene_type:complete